MLEDASKTILVNVEAEKVCNLSDRNFKALSNVFVVDDVESTSSRQPVQLEVLPVHDLALHEVVPICNCQYCVKVIFGWLKAEWYNGHLKGTHHLSYFF